MTEVWDSPWAFLVYGWGFGFATSAVFFFAAYQVGAWWAESAFGKR